MRNVIAKYIPDATVKIFPHYRTDVGLYISRVAKIVVIKMSCVVPLISFSYLLNLVNFFSYVFNHRVHVKVIIT